MISKEELRKLISGIGLSKEEKSLIELREIISEIIDNVPEINQALMSSIADILELQADFAEKAAEFQEKLAEKADEIKQHIQEIQ